MASRSAYRRWRSVRTRSNWSSALGPGCRRRLTWRRARSLRRCQGMVPPRGVASSPDGKELAVGTSRSHGEGLERGRHQIKYLGSKASKSSLPSPMPPAEYIASARGLREHGTWQRAVPPNVETGRLNCPVCPLRRQRSLAAGRPAGITSWCTTSRPVASASGSSVLVVSMAWRMTRQPERASADLADRSRSLHSVRAHRSREQKDRRPTHKFDHSYDVHKEPARIFWPSALVAEAALAVAAKESNSAEVRVAAGELAEQMLTQPTAVLTGHTAAVGTVASAGNWSKLCRLLVPLRVPARGAAHAHRVQRRTTTAWWRAR